MLKNNGYKKGLQFLIVGLLAYMVVRLFVDPNYIADFEAYCPIGGMQAFSSFLVNNTLACSMTETQIFMGIVLLAGVVIFGKLFCSYICPIGTFTEWLGKIGDKIKMQYTISGIADRGLRIFKYGLLFVTFYFTVKTSELFCKEFDPYYAVFSGFGYDVYLWYAIPALLITVLGAIFIRQFWCKYLCPLECGNKCVHLCHTSCRSDCPFSPHQCPGCGNKLGLVIGRNIHHGICFRISKTQWLDFPSL